MTTLQKTFAAVTVALAVGAGIYEAHQTATLRDQIATRHRKQLFLAREIQQLQREWNAATNPSAYLSLTNGGHVHGNITGILTDSNFRMVLHALQQRSGFESLAEPEVATTSGRGQNSIRMENVVWNMILPMTNASSLHTR